MPAAKREELSRQRRSWREGRPIGSYIIVGLCLAVASLAVMILYFIVGRDEPSGAGDDIFGLILFVGFVGGSILAYDGMRGQRD